MKFLVEMRTGERLDARSVHRYACIFMAMNIASLAYLLATSHRGVDQFGNLLGTDFLSFWAAGKLLTADIYPYDVASHLAAQKAFFAGLEGYFAFFYPPLFLLICWPLAFLPYFAALGMWLTVTGMAYVAAAALWWKQAQPKWHLAVWLAAFPPVWLTITHGQTSFLSSALLGAGMFLVPRRPVCAGVLLGLAAFKPQFGLLIPFALLLTGRWTAFAAAAAVATMLALLNTAFFGWEIWPDWFALSGRASEAMASGKIGFAKMITVFAGARLAGAPIWLAYVLQACMTAIIIAAVAWAAWSRGWTDGVGALILAGAALATPFALDYDLLIVSFPLIWLASIGYRDWERWMSAMMFATPLFARPLAMNTSVPIMPIVLGILFFMVWRRTLQAPVIKRRSSPGPLRLRDSG